MNIAKDRVIILKIGKEEGEREMPMGKTEFDLAKIVCSMITNVKPEVKRILKSGPATIVFWTDGTKTIVRKSADTPDDDFNAFTAALAKKIYGSTNAVKKIVRQIEAQEIRKGKEDADK